VRIQNLKIGKIFLYLVLLGLFPDTIIFLSGCRPASSVQPYKDGSDADILQPSGKIDIEFYIDASKSMRGFRADTDHRLAERAKRKPNQANHFTDLLREVDSTLNTAWPTTTSHYWRFGGGEPQKIDSAKKFSGQPDLFTENTTRIDKAIQHKVKAIGGGNQLKIILTDLFQDENDVGRLATELGRLYLHSENSAVGILGVRNDFSGAVYDLPGTVPADGVDSLPFYMLVAGPVADVYLTIQTLAPSVGVGQLSDDKCLHAVFSRRLLARLKQQLEVGPADADRPGYVVSNSIVPGPRDPAVPQVGVYRRVTKLKQSFHLDKQDAANMTGWPHGLLPKLNSSVLMWSEKDHGWVPAPDNAVAAFQVEYPDRLRFQPSMSASAKEPDGQLIGTGSLTIDARNLPKNSIYMLRYDLLSQKGDVSGVDAWNLENTEARQIVSNGRFDGKDGSRPGRTPNLRFFLQTISHTTFQSEIQLAHYYLYVKIL
jgi:hypothetical protein